MMRNNSWQCQRLVSAALLQVPVVSSWTVMNCPPCLPLEYHWRWSLAPWSCQRRAGSATLEASGVPTLRKRHPHARAPGSPHHHGETSVAPQNPALPRPKKRHRGSNGCNSKCKRKVSPHLTNRAERRAPPRQSVLGWFLSYNLQSYLDIFKPARPVRI